MKKKLQNIVLASGALLLALLGMETFVRTYIPQITYKCGQSYRDEDVFDLKKNFSGIIGHPDYEHSVTTDSDRFRTTWTSGTSHERTKIVVLGDSFVFGIGVEDDLTIPSKLAIRLDNRGLPARVWNAGVPAYSLSEIICKFDRIGEGISPDVVVVIASFNDLLAKSELPCHDSYLQNNRKRGGREEFSSLWSNLYPDVRDFLLGRSQLFVFLARRFNQLLVKWGVRASFVSTMFYYDERAREDRRAAVAQSALATLKTLIDQSNTTAVFVYLPGYLEVSDDLWNLAEADYDGAAVRSLPHDTLVAAAKRIGFKHVIDPYIDNAGECISSSGYAS